MDPQLLQYLLIAAVVVIVVLIVLFIVVAKRRKEREELRDRYGAEYDRTVQEQGSKRAAVRDLKEREALHSDLRLRDLNDADRDLIRGHMATLQYRFVEDPADVLLSTDRVVTEVLRARGYPVAEDREKALRLFSVDHPSEAGHVRTVMEGSHHGDVATMRESFLGVRRVLQEVAGVSYVLGDAADTPAGLSPGEQTDQHAGPSETALPGPPPPAGSSATAPDPAAAASPGPTRDDTGSYRAE
ncbi:MAG: hypothetical protein H0V19_01110 [Euzebyales bacterium]|nr:hypothetical protein [Euzebyales bacterium]